MKIVKSIIVRMIGFWIVPLLVLCPVTRAYAVQEFTIKKYVDGEIPNLVKVHAPGGRCIAVSDAAGFLAVGHHPPAVPNPAVIAPNISIFKLDAEGKPTGAPPVAITMPKPATLNAYPHYPLCLTFHPTFPLLYVWQDVEPPKTEDPALKVPYQEFDHLLIYDLSATEPKLIESFCRGTGFGFGAKIGGMLLTAEASRLYIPNVMHATLTKDVSVNGVGWIAIDADGLPALQTGDAAENAVVTPMPARPKLDPAAAATARLAKQAEIQAVKTAGKIPIPRMVTTAPSVSFPSVVPSGVGFYAGAENVVVFGSYVGIVCWDQDNRQGRIVFFWLYPSIPYCYHVGGHPDIPSIFISLVPYSIVFRFTQADGYPTLAPQTVSFDATAVRSAPVTMVRRKQVAIGCSDKIVSVELDEKGRMTSKAWQSAVPGQMVEAITFSEKFDRLYIAVEKAP